MIDITQSASYTGDCRDLLARLPEKCIQTCVTSPPYWGLRDYGVDRQLGLEQSPHEYVANMVEVFRGVRRALREDGTLWLNLGDSYADKSLVGIPWMVAFALREDGWFLRSDIIWAKPNPMPESVTDRPTKAHEYVFLLSKSQRYYYDEKAIREDAVCTPRPETSRNDGGALGENLRSSGLAVGHKGGSLGFNRPELGRNKRSVWTVATQPFDGAHFATMPPALADPCVLAGSRVGDVVLDPFFGSGTTGMVAEKHGRKWIGFDLNPSYKRLQDERTAQRSLRLG
jgi:DNA modification methylase